MTEPRDMPPVFDYGQSRSPRRHPNGLGGVLGVAAGMLGVFLLFCTVLCFSLVFFYPDGPLLGAAYLTLFIGGVLVLVSRDTLRAMFRRSR